MKRCFGAFFGVLLMALLGGCNQAAIMDSLTPPEDLARAKAYIDLLRSGQFDAIEKDADPQIAGPHLHATLIDMAKLIPAGEPLSQKIFGTRTNTAYANGSTTRTVEISLEYQFPEHWLLFNTVVRTTGNTQVLAGFGVRPVSDSIENMNQFALSGKSFAQYSVLALACLVPLFIVATLIACIRTRPLRRKWLWIIFILFGIGQMSINWTTGQWGWHVVQFQLLGAGFFRPLYGTWTLFVSFPVGAVVFLVHRYRLRRPVPSEGQGR